ncbi:MAG: hypothetical protein QOE59_5153 [Actinomycetota bacterium]|jgi:UDP:flavonoid glycosyltransferase YjiC (YdhE family)|nr:hypothetical protein [Actinomycetota bacterium]
MARILAVTWDGGGNVPPLLGITAELLARHHDVRVLGHPSQRATVEAAGATFVPHRHARPWSPTTPVSDVRRARDLITLFSEPGPGRDVAAELDGPAPPDLVLVDGMRLAALQAAVRSPVPTVALVHTFHRYLTRVWARGPVGLLATLRGRRPGPLWNACERVLVATDADLDPVGPGSGNLRWTGAVQAGPRPVARGTTSTVLVSLSTIFYPTQAAVLQNVLDGLAELDVHVVVATGPVVDPGDLRAGANAELHRHLAHDAVMPAASVLVGHGGHATTMRALAHDLPVLTIPLDPHLDHRMIGEAVRAAGAGLVLETGASPTAIRDATRTLLDDPAHRTAAEVLGARLRSTDGAARAADEIEAVLGGARSPSTSTSAERDHGRP